MVPALLLAIGVAWSTFVRVRDSLEQQRGAIAADWSNLDGALQERAGLIRGLVEAGRGSARPTDDIRREVAGAYAEVLGGATPQARINANQRLSAALAKLLVAADSRPGAKPDRASLLLQEQIKNSDERVAVARLKYNETLEHYNARIQQFPHNLVAKIAGFSRNEAYYQTEPF